MGAHYEKLLARRKKFHEAERKRKISEKCRESRLIFLGKKVKKGTVDVQKLLQFTKNKFVL
jgi:hypothetical protein